MEAASVNFTDQYGVTLSVTHCVNSGIPQQGVLREATGYWSSDAVSLPYPPEDTDKATFPLAEVPGNQQTGNPIAGFCALHEITILCCTGNVHVGSVRFLKEEEFGLVTVFRRGRSDGASKLRGETEPTNSCATQVAPGAGSTGRLGSLGALVRWFAGAVCLLSSPGSLSVVAGCDWELTTGKVELVCHAAGKL
jgi:hypothetical protein